MLMPFLLSPRPVLHKTPLSYLVMLYTLLVTSSKAIPTMDHVFASSLLVPLGCDPSVTSVGAIRLRLG